MPLSAGDKLGPYEIVAPIGAGGMGEVYRARDTKLKRDVAIKVLPEAFARDPDRMRRFQREAELLASLNHPNIAHIYGVAESENARALIMELVEGQTLPSGLPIDTALRYALQIAEALEYAHDRGIMHRDLKPANIKVTPEGVVKLLDFGLAKAVDAPAASSADPANSPTLTLGATRVGVILGTAAYMSPEQAGGKIADRRADIWSFGAVLYEMLAGKRAFSGESASDTLASVLKLDPDWKALPKETPTSVSRLLRRCLTKDRRQRLQAIGEARISLEEDRDHSKEDAEIITARPRFGWAFPALAMLLAVGLTTLAFIHFREKPPTPELTRFEIPAPGGATVSNYLALSPDGRKLAFLATGKDSSQMVWIRSLDASEARPLAGTEGAANSFLVWSPDSRLVAFASGGQLKKIEVAGGTAQTVCAATALVDGFWTPDNKIVYGTFGPIFEVSASGGTPTQLTAPDLSRGELIHAPGTLLPDGRHFLYWRLSSANENRGIYVGSLDTKPEQQSTKKLLSDASSVRYVPSAEATPAPGFLLFVRGAFLAGTLLAQPFDPRRLELSRDAVPIAEQVYVIQGFSATSSGSLAYRDIAAQANQLAWMDRSGKITATAAPPGIYNNFRLAPDDKRVAFDRLRDVWVMDLVRGVPSQLTFGPARSNLPIWSADGLRILYPSQRRGVFDLYIKSASGAGQEEVMVKLGTGTGWATSWSRDGRYVLYQMPSDKSRQELWIAPQFGDRKPFPYLQTQFNEQNGAFSPDGHWVAYVSDETGPNEIYVQAFPRSGAKFQISATGGFEPAWRKDGTELFYVAADRNVMAVPVKFTPTFDPGVPKRLFPLPNAVTTGALTTYGVAGDGQRFLVATPAGTATQGASSGYQVVLNWTQMSKK